MGAIWRQCYTFVSDLICSCLCQIGSDLKMLLQMLWRTFLVIESLSGMRKEVRLWHRNVGTHGLCGSDGETRITHGLFMENLKGSVL